LFAFPLQTMNGYPRTSWLEPKVIRAHNQLTWRAVARFNAM
jgi:hypothetical protein